MQLGISLWSFFHEQDSATWPALAEAVDDVLMLDASLGVEIWGSRALDQPMVEGQELADLVDGCQAAAFTTVHIQGRHWSWNPATLRQEIDFAHLLGAETLVLHPACLGLQDTEDRPDWPEVVRIADYAAKFGVRLVVENLFDSLWCLDRVLEEIGDDPEQTNIGICIDIGHAMMSKDAGRHPAVNYLERYARQLSHLHLHDNHGEHDGHLLPGEGNVDWPSVLETLETIGFSGTAVLEMHEPNTPPKEFLGRGLAYLKQVGF